MTPDATTDVHLEIWSDVACPWCFVGRRNLRIALDDLDDPHLQVGVTWHAFQLDPSLPEEGVDAEAYFAAKFPNEDVFQDARERLVALGEEVGIDFRFDRQRTVPNTHFAHRVIAAAADTGVQEAVLDALFSGYFERGVDIADQGHVETLLASVLEDAALAAQLCAAAREDESLHARVDADIAEAGRLGITGVPTFVANRRIAVPGAVPPPVLAQLITQAAGPGDADDGDDED